MHSRFNGSIPALIRAHALVCACKDIMTDVKLELSDAYRHLAYGDNVAKDAESLRTLIIALGEKIDALLDRDLDFESNKGAREMLQKSK